MKPFCGYLVTDRTCFSCSRLYIKCRQRLFCTHVVAPESEGVLVVGVPFVVLGVL